MISYGIDIGTTTLRAIAVNIHINSLGERSFQVIGKPLCIFTPYTKERDLDEERITEELEAWITQEKIPTPDIGTLLFTGEAQRAQNATTFGQFLSSRWQGLLSAQLNPEMESRIAALGSGARELSQKHLGKPIIHIDIGGGTSNFALLENGEILDTACLDIGCRKWIFNDNAISYLTHQGKYIASLAEGKQPEQLAKVAVDLLIAYCQGKTDRLGSLEVVPWKSQKRRGEFPILSISGGVAECEGEETTARFGDIGPYVYRELKRRDAHIVFSREQGKATALGVSTFGFHFSGKSIHCDRDFPAQLRNVRLLSETEIRESAALPEVFALTASIQTTTAEEIEAYAIKMRQRIPAGKWVLFLFQGNIAKSFGYYFSKKSGERAKILALDEVRLETRSTNLQTMDMTYAKDTDRYLVVLKSLHLF